MHFDFSSGFSYEDNPNGTVKSMKDRNGNTFVYSYDLLDRYTKTTSGSESIQQAFDGNGNLTLSKNNSAEVILSYDFMNRAIQKSHAKQGLNTFEYDITAGLTLGENKEVTTDLQGNVFEKVFDQNGRLSKVIDGADTASYTYADNGALLRLNYPGTIQQQFEYNPDLTLKKVSNTAGSSVINTFDYTYDPCGNMLTKTDSKGTTKYTYDALNRLKTVTEPTGKNVEYEYDKAGNRIREVIEDKGTLTVKKYKYNPQNRLTEVVNIDTETGKEESIKYTYDNNGNQLYTNMEHTQKADPTAKPSFGMYISGQSYSGESAKVFFEANNVNEYNVFNQLIRTKAGDTVVTYKYNGEGQRIEKTTQKKGDKKTIRYVRLGNDIALELDSKGKLISRNISGTAAISREIDGQKYFLLYNGEGDVTALSDRSGNLAEKYYYDAFGNVLETVDATNQAITSGKSKSTLKYRGYEYDEETKLYYLNSRMYDPAIARFLQEDTYRGQANDPLSLNLYTYCHNDPINYTDPSGHSENYTVIPNEDGTLTFKFDSRSNGQDIHVYGGNGDKVIIDSDANIKSVGIHGDVKEVINNGTVENLNSTTGTKIRNNRDVDRMNLGNNTTSTVDNSGYINDIDIGKKSTADIDNSWYIGRITGGDNSKLNLNNDGYVGQVFTGQKSENRVRSAGIIGSLVTGDGSNTYTDSYSESNILNYSGDGNLFVDGKIIVYMTKYYAHPYELGNDTNIMGFLSDIKNRTVYGKAADDSNRLSFEQMESNARYIYEYLSDKGWTKEAICGLLGNIQQESWFNPGDWQKLNNIKLGYGLVQWDDATKFLDWAELNVKSANKLANNEPNKLMDLELEFLIHSSQSKTKREWLATKGYGSPYKMTYQNYIQSTASAGDLALVFHASYERSSDDEGKLNQRKEWANKWYELIGNTEETINWLSSIK